MEVEAIENIRRFFTTGTTHRIAFRYEQLAALKQAIIREEKTLLDALHKDLAKPPFESYLSEIHFIIQEINYTLSELHTWTRPSKLPTSFLHFPMTSLLQPEPRGIVLIIGAWNYPLQVLLAPLIGAIAAGNCAVLKPSEQAPHCSRTIAKLIANTFQPDYVTVIEGDGKTAEQLLKKKFDYIFFTGSARVGTIVMTHAAQHLTPVTLELGGKNPCIVSTTTNLDCAAQRIVWGKFYNAGQNCISPDYLLVEASIQSIFIKKLHYWIKKFYGENPLASPDYARIINNYHLQRLQQLLNGGTVRIGGTIDAAQNYMAPTVLDNVDLTAPVMQEEIFGPILPVIPYTALEKALAIIMARPSPLVLYLFSSSRDEQNNVRHQTQSGAVCINDVLLYATSSYIPFGGVGASGFGSYHGKKTFDTFTHYKPIIENSCRFDYGLRYPPYGKK